MDVEPADCVQLATSTGSNLNERDAAARRTRRNVASNRIEEPWRAPPEPGHSPRVCVGLIDGATLSSGVNRCVLPRHCPCGKGVQRSISIPL